MHPLFKNKKYQELFSKDGFVKLDDFNMLNIDINNLLEFLKLSGIKNDVGFDVSKDHSNKVLVEQMMGKINTTLSKYLDYYLVDYKIFLSSFLIKSANTLNPIMPHQDETFVEDETKHISINCWIPLIDTNESNGCIGVIRKSHKLFNYVCPIPGSAIKGSVEKNLSTLVPYLEWIPMQAGEMIFLNYKTIHASLPNLSDFPRVAISIWITHKEAEYCTYYLNPNKKNKLLKYKIDTNFYIKYSDSILSKMYYNHQLIDDFKIMEEIEYTYKEINPSIIEETLIKPEIENNKNYKYFNIEKRKPFENNIAYKFLSKIKDRLFRKFK
jgi:hypothetical protein